MDIVPLLPSLLHLVRLAFSVVRSPSGDYDPPASGPPKLTDFDVDVSTGFLPARPLPRLRGAHALWEDALEEAKQVLRLAREGEPGDLAMAPSAEQDAGHAWRAKIREVNRLAPFVRRLLTKLFLPLAPVSLSFSAR
jgi:hypothetical protein